MGIVGTAAGDSAVPQHPATSVQFVDADMGFHEVSGVVTIGKATDESGISAELYKESVNATAETIAEVMTQIINGDTRIPDYWHKNRFNMIPKNKGHCKVTEHRPTANFDLLQAVFKNHHNKIQTVLRRRSPARTSRVQKWLLSS